MMRAGVGRFLATPFILFNLTCAIVILVLAGWVLDGSINGDGGALSGFEGNGATPFLIIFSLIAGMVAIASYVSVAHHIVMCSSDSGAAARAAGWIAWLLLVLTFSLAWKEIQIGGRGTKLKVLETFVIILTFTQFWYHFELCIGDCRNAEGTDSRVLYTDRRPQSPDAPTHNNISEAASEIVSE